MATVNPGRGPIRTPRATKLVLTESDFDQPNANGNIQFLEDTQYLMEGAVDVGGLAFETIQGSINTLTGSTTGLQQIENCGGFIQNGGNLIIRDMVFRAGTGQLLDVTGTVNAGPGPPLRGLLRIFSYNEFLRFDNLGTIDTMDRILIEDSFFSNTAGPLTINDVLLCDVSHNRFDYLGLGPVVPQGFTWLRYTGSAAELIIQNNTFFIEAGTFRKYGVYIEPTIAPNAALPFANTQIVIEGNTSNRPEEPFFETGDEDEITAFADAGGGFVTVSTSNTHSLANGDIVNILRTQNYNGGYTVSSVVANTSFDIEATFVDNVPRGTWHTGSMDQRDARVRSSGNIGIPDSRHVAFGYTQGNTQATSIAAFDTWYPLDLTGFVDLEGSTERFALVGDGVEGEFVYQGVEDFKGVVTASITAETQSAQTNDYFFAISVNGADPVANVPELALQVSTVAQNGTLICGMTLLMDDTVRIMVRETGVGQTEDITVTNCTFLLQDSN